MTKNVLFLCTGNSARSILAEAYLNRVAAQRFRGFSAGSHPSGTVQPLALELLRKHRIDVQTLRSKSWDEFAAPGAPVMDFVITVCDSAAGEPCPHWPGQPITAHWGVPDPAAVAGPEDQKRKAYLAAYTVLARRIGLLLALPLERLDALALKHQVDKIGRSGQEQAERT